MDVKCLSQAVTDKYALYHGDACEVLAALPDNSVGHSVFSPPFSDLYCYSDSPRDLGNCKSHEEFMAHFMVIASELHRVMKYGRVVAVHCMDLPAQKERDGYIGLKDFSGEIIRLFQSAGFIYHSRVVIWKDPLIAATRTKAIGLMHKQICKDSALCRMGIPDQVIAFRKGGENDTPIENPDGLSRYAGANDPGLTGVKRSHMIWRAYASPIWDDIRQSGVLKRAAARMNDDEKHVCPLQLDVVERCLTLWSRKGDVVLTPFMGVGSEAFMAVKMGRKAIGVELKDTYYRQAVSNVEQAATEQNDHADLIDMASEVESHA